MFNQVYRTNYSGDEIVTEAAYENSEWRYVKESTRPSFEFVPASGRAVVLGNGLSQKIINLNLLKKSRGFNNSKTLKVYGCNALYRDFDPDFLVVTRDTVAKEIATQNLKSGDYCKNNVVYASVKNILDYPGNFHVIPQNPGWNSGAIATYLACFDGHTTVYLIGHDPIDSNGADYNIYSGTNGYNQKSNISNQFYETCMLNVFNTYASVNFVLVNKTGKGYIPESWKYCLNLRRLSLRGFVLEADI
jgi:hypothetical protein